MPSMLRKIALFALVRQLSHSRPSWHEKHKITRKHQDTRQSASILGARASVSCSCLLLTMSASITAARCGSA